MKLSFEASVLAHVALRMLADTLHRWVTLLLLIFILSVWTLKSEVWSPFTASVGLGYPASAPNFTVGFFLRRRGLRVENNNKFSRQFLQVTCIRNAANVPSLLFSWDGLEPSLPDGQQVKNRCPPKLATCINKQNLGTTRKFINYYFPRLC